MKFSSYSKYNQMLRDFEEILQIPCQWKQHYLVKQNVRSWGLKQEMAGHYFRAYQDEKLQGADCPVEGVSNENT